jgi:hypothetical protein
VRAGLTRRLAVLEQRVPPPPLEDPAVVRERIMKKLFDPAPSGPVRRRPPNPAVDPIRERLLAKLLGPEGERV